MEKTVCELFAGVGGFRCGLNNISELRDMKKPEKWNTVWFNQWEPAEKKTQYAHGCYVYHFGTCKDLCGNDTTNCDIEDVDKSCIPDFNLLVGGFPCQDYSVASSLAVSKGIEGKRAYYGGPYGKYWRKKPPFVLLENVDRLIKSPAKQRGRDFGIMLACFRDEGYTVEWRVINAADYGYQQRRSRVFIFAYKNDTAYAGRSRKAAAYMPGDEAAIPKESAAKQKESMAEIMLEEGFFAKTFPVDRSGEKEIKTEKLPEKLAELSDGFSFENTGVMLDGKIYTLKTTPLYHGERLTLGEIMETGEVDGNFFIPEERLYYTAPEITHSDESRGRLSKEERHTWQYIKGAKKMLRRAANGHEYLYSEGAIPMLDEYDKPARTMLTSEGSFARTTHIVKDKRTGRIRLLTPTETERIQGFPDNHTQKCIVDGKVVEMPANKRRFMMGNALVVNLIKDMEKTLNAIFEEEK